MSTENGPETGNGVSSGGPEKKRVVIRKSLLKWEKGQPGGGDGEAPRRPKHRYALSGGNVATPVVALLFIILFAVGLFVWFGMRIEVGPGDFVVVVKKTGADLRNEQLLAPDAEHKGVQVEVLKEGRHFRNPFHWAWTEPKAAPLIPQGEVGIQVRKHGTPLPPGQILALSGEQKGIVPGVLTPGRYYLNPYAYAVETFGMVKIEPGYVGIVTLQVGSRPSDSFAFVVEDGAVGVQKYLLPPGTHPEYSNPYVHRITPIDVRSQKFEMRDAYAISFPSKFGFDIKVEGTIEWAPDLTKLPELFVKYVDERDLKASGGINNIQQKVILPFARSFFRTVGGRYRAVDYITGDTRIVVQNEVEKRLMQTCAEEGILIKSVVIRATEPPQAIREQFQRREIAKRKRERFEKEIEMQIGTIVAQNGVPQRDAEGREVREGGRLTRVIQERKKDREQQLGLVRAEVATLVRRAEEYRNVQLTQGNRRVEVAKIQLEAAKDKAAGVKAEGFAEAAVKVMEYQAQAEGVKAKVDAFGTGEKYADYLLITRLAPGIRDVLSNTEGTFAELFERFATAGQSEGQQ
ncbi:MAG: hypothetical protein JXR37_08925 [Kiritimatiellae bacterium]|nr:hypothetical protein [Kiritimatiellia bacterium]